MRCCLCGLCERDGEKLDGCSVGETEGYAWGGGELQKSGRKRQNRFAERKARRKVQGRRGRLTCCFVRQAAEGEPSEGA